MRRLITLILCFLFITISLTASAVIVIRRAGCGSCGDNAVIGNVTDWDASSSFEDTWYAVKHTSSTASSCVCKFRVLENSGGDACASNNTGWVIYAHDSGNDKPDGSNIICSGTAIVSWTGNAVITDIPFGTTCNISDSTIYWTAIIVESTCNAKVEVDISGETARTCDIAGSYDSPPTNWSGASCANEREVAIQATY